MQGHGRGGDTGAQLRPAAGAQLERTQDYGRRYERPCLGPAIRPRRKKVASLLTPTINLIYPPPPPLLPPVLTAGLPISLTSRHCHNLFCRDPILKPRPVLDFPAQTTPGKVLDFFVKPQNGLVALVFENRCFLGGVRNKIGPLSSN